MSDILDTSELFPAPRLLWAGRVRSYPIAGDATAIFWKEDYIACRSRYERAQMSSPSERMPTAILVDEQPTKEEGDLIWFSRTYATVPATRDEPSTIAFRFPGFSIGDALGGTTVLRQPLAVATLARVRHEYFVTDDPFGVINPANKIQILEVFSALAITEGITGESDFVTESTFPTLDAYLTMKTNKALIVAKDSEITRYAGNIWERRTVYTEAR